MKFGICTSPEYSAAVKSAGFDYLEPALVSIAAMDESELGRCKAALAVPAFSFNNFFDRDKHRLVGESVDCALLEEYIRNALKNAAKLGCKTAVLGSGFSRTVPDGYDRAKALSQFRQVVILAGKIAAEYGITVAVEPLNHNETNLLSTFSETAEFVRAVGMDNVGVTADFYHIAQTGEGLDGLYQNAGLLRHVHICHPGTRMMPKPGDGFDYNEFKTIFDRIGYDGLVSVEGRAQNPEQDIPLCVKALSCLM
ncbi:MAG TPA: sugar phosphate isomerase/epimerase family protein [Oscillospiraceae bacterium]|nr:sugar phosphate isomerase/epimerase family protein [Oscillospiraceae bacterium]HPS34428.1 sugar phosphate isomerase/epimerase family protein [Oscillospiraceae bacterium]